MSAGTSFAAPRHGVAFTTLVAALFAAAPVASQPTPQGSELQVNEYTTGTQRTAAVAVDGDGGFVVAWESFGSYGSDTSLSSVQARRYDGVGVPLGGQFQVNEYTTAEQFEPAVAIDPFGGFVVAWASFGSPGSDGSNVSVQARRYDAAGNPVGPQFQVNTYTLNGQGEPAVGVDAIGEFVVVWTSAGSAGTDGSGTSIQAQRYGADGDPVGLEFQVNADTTGNQSRPAIAVGADGGFVVVWESDSAGPGDPSPLGLRARRFAADATPLGAELQVNALTSGQQVWPAVGLAADGGFVVAWQSDVSAGGDTSATSIQVRRFDVAGTPLGVELQANDFTSGAQRYPALAVEADGSFVVAWDSDGSPGDDQSFWSTQARAFGAAGEPWGGQFEVNGYTSYGQVRPSVAVDGDSDFVVAWESSGSFGTDDSGPSIQARRYDVLFRDGFESGDAGRWSEVAL